MRFLILATLVALAVATAAAGPAGAATSAVYPNTTPIVIPGTPQTSPFQVKQAAPYPSQVSVQGLPGRITDVIVQLRQFGHSRPSDVDILLVSPGGETSVVMSDACGGAAIPNATWTFLQSAPVAMGDSSCDGSFYRPTNLFRPQPEQWPGAPPGPHAANFDRFLGDDPNGTWGLYVVDDEGGQSGRINLGWSLTIETAAADVVVPGPGQGGRASPYPSIRTISGVDGVIADVDVALRGVYHERPDDLELLLVAPRGQAVVLMSDVCQDRPATAADWVWNDEASSVMPPFGDPCPSGSYRPTDNFAGESLPVPAPAGPHGTSLSAFDATDPNGEWRLYAYDEQEGDANGFFIERFALQIQTRPRAKVGFAAGVVEVTEGQSRELTLARSAMGPLGAGSVKVTSSPLSADSGNDFTPVSTTVEFAAGETQRTISVDALTDAVSEEPETFALTIGPASGDAEPATPPTAVVTIRDPTASPGAGDPSAGRDAGDPSGGGAGVPLAFGSRTLVTLRLAGKRIPPTGPLKVRVTNRNGFAVSGILTARGRRARLRGPSFRLGAQAGKTLELKLPKAVRRLLERKGQLSLRLTARVEDPAGRTRNVNKRVSPKLKSAQARTPRGDRNGI